MINEASSKKNVLCNKQIDIANTPQSSKAVCIPTTKILATNSMVKGGIAHKNVNKNHKRTYSDTYP